MGAPTNTDPEQQTPSSVSKFPDEKNDFSAEKDGVEIQVLNSLRSTEASKPFKQRFASLWTKKTMQETGAVLWKLARFMGPGAVITVAYVDPDNLQSNLTSGAEFKFKLLFMILFSNVVAVFLQVSSFWLLD
jgi:metal iron transporter